MSLKNNDDEPLVYIWADGDFITEESREDDGFPHWKSDDYITVTNNTLIADIISWCGRENALSILKEINDND